MKVQFRGTTDDVTQCECCGRNDLKSTVALSFDDGESVVYYGTQCAARALEMSAADVRKGTRAADRAKREEAEEQERQRRNAEMIREESARIAAAKRLGYSPVHLSTESFCDAINRLESRYPSRYEAARAIREEAGEFAGRRKANG